MTHQPPSAPQSPAIRYLRRLLWRLVILVLVVAAGYALLIGAWVVLNPRW